MKKKLLVLLLCLCVLLCGCELDREETPPATEPPVEYDEKTSLAYQLIQDGAAYAIVGITDESMEELVLPTEFNGKPVTRLSSLILRKLEGEGDFSISIGGGGIVSAGTNIKSLTISETVVELEVSALSMCGGLETLQIAEGNPAFCVSDGLLLSKDGKTLLSAFTKRGATELTIPDGVTTVAAGSIYIPTLETLVLGKNVSSIEPYALSGSKSLKAFVVPEGNAYFMLKDAVLYSADGKTLVRFPAGSEAQYYEVPDGVTTIAAGAGLGKLGIVALPLSVTAIQAGAFTNEGTGSMVGGSQFLGTGTAIMVTNIQYAGTTAQWDKVVLEEGWYPVFEADLFKLSIICSDGEVSNNGPDLEVSQ